MTTKEDDPNNVLIPREIGERKSLFGKKTLREEPPQNDPVKETRRFEVMPNETSFKKSCSCKKSGVCPVCGKAKEPTSPQRVTSENYRQVYLERQKEERAEAARKRQEATRKAGSHAAAEQQREALHRARAHDLQDQIEHWKNQYSAGQYDKGTIDGMLSSLEGELSGIPSIYWR